MHAWGSTPMYTYTTYNHTQHSINTDIHIYTAQAQTHKQTHTHGPNTYYTHSTAETQRHTCTHSTDI